MTYHSSLNEEMVAHAPTLTTIATDDGGLFVDAVIADGKSTLEQLAVMFMTHRVWAYAKGALKSHVGGLHSLASLIITLDQIM